MAADPETSSGRQSKKERIIAFLLNRIDAVNAFPKQ